MNPGPLVMQRDLCGTPYMGYLKVTRCVRIFTIDVDHTVALWEREGRSNLMVASIRPETAASGKACAAGERAGSRVEIDRR